LQTAELSSHDAIRLLEAVLMDPQYSTPTRHNGHFLDVNDQRDQEEYSDQEGEQPASNMRLQTPPATGSSGPEIEDHRRAAATGLGAHRLNDTNRASRETPLVSENFTVSSLRQSHAAASDIVSIQIPQRMGQRSRVNAFAEAQDNATRRHAREEYHNRPRQLVTSVPRIISATVFDTRWFLPMMNMAFLVTPSSWFCTRCAIVQQLEIVAENELIPTNDGEECCGVLLHRPAVSLCLMLSIDALTLGFLGGCFYHGLGTAFCGCRTRWLLRKKYHLYGFGYSDFLSFLCCASPAAEQQWAELQRHGMERPERPWASIMI
jgi:Cys-rich protein (TIGR01571 family)